MTFEFVGKLCYSEGEKGETLSPQGYQLKTKRATGLGSRQKQSNREKKKKSKTERQTLNACGANALSVEDSDPKR